MKEKLKFRVRGGFRIPKAAAEPVGSLIVELAEQGRHSPKALVDAARSPKSRAHKFFEWNNSKAAEQWRIEQAKLYQRAIEYEVIIKPGPRGKVIKGHMRVVYPVLDADGDESYASGGAVVRDADMMEQLVNRAKADALHWRDRWNNLRHVKELTGLFKAVDKLRTR